MSKRRQPRDIKDTLGMSKKTENKHLKDFVREQIDSAIEGVPFHAINQRIEEELMKSNIPRFPRDYMHSEDLIDAHYDLEKFNLELTDLFENVEIRSARDLEMTLRLMRSNSDHHLRDVFTEEENNSRSARNFYELAKFKFNMPDGFNRSKSPNGKQKNFALYKEKNKVFALTPNEVYCMLDGKFKIGYKTGERGIAGILDSEFEYVPFNNITAEEGRLFIDPANNLLNYRAEVSNPSSILSDSFAASYLILGSEADRYSLQTNKENPTPLERLIMEDPSISPLLSNTVNPIVELQYRKGLSPTQIKERLKRGDSPLYKIEEQVD